MKHGPTPPPIPPLGTRESETLEIKSARILDDDDGLTDLLQEIVGMLNAQGGEIWVGCKDEQDAVSAYEPMPREKLSKWVVRLQDKLVECVEPPPAETEVRWTLVPQGDGFLLCISVSPRVWPRRRPYCRKGKKGSRSFPIRRMARLDPLTYEEISSGFSGEDTRAAALAEALREARLLGRGDLPHLLLILALRTADGRDFFPLTPSALSLINRVRTHSILNQGRPRWRRRRTRITSSKPEAPIAFTLTDSGILVARIQPDPSGLASFAGPNLPLVWGMRLMEFFSWLPSVWAQHLRAPSWLFAEFSSHRLPGLVKPDEATAALNTSEDFTVRPLQPVRGFDFLQNPMALPTELLEYALEHLGIDDATHRARATMNQLKTLGFHPDMVLE